MKMVVLLKTTTLRIIPNFVINMGKVIARIVQLAESLIYLNHEGYSDVNC